MSPLVCVRPPIPQLWRATRNLLLCGVPSCHLLCVDVRFDDGLLDLSCRRLVRRSCVLDASPGAATSGFMPSSAAACLGSMNPTHWSIASERLVGGGFIAGAGGRDGVDRMFCPTGMVTSLHRVISAILTHLVIVELALIITLPSVAAIGHRVA